VPLAYLATNDADTWHQLAALLLVHLLDLVVAVDDAQQVQQLPLVLVDALHLIRQIRAADQTSHKTETIMHSHLSLCSKAGHLCSLHV